MGFRVVVPGVLLLALAAGEARSEPPGMVAPTPPPKDAAPARKSPALALGLSLGTSALAGVVLAAGQDNPGAVTAGVVGLYVGPSFGRWYGGGSAAIGLLARLGGAGLMYAGINESMTHPIDDCVPDIDLGEDCDAEDAAKAEQDRRVKRLIYTGAAIWIGATIYDIVRAPLDARDFNREHAVNVAPTVLRGGGQGGALVPGLAVQGRF